MLLLLPKKEQADRLLVTDTRDSVTAGGPAKPTTNHKTMKLYLSVRLMAPLPLLVPSLCFLSRSFIFLPSNCPATTFQITSSSNSRFFEPARSLQIELLRVRRING